MNNASNAQAPATAASAARPALRDWARSLTGAMPRIMIGSAGAALAMRALSGAVAWLNARLIGQAGSWALPAIGAAAAGLVLWRSGFGRQGGDTGTDVYIAALRGRGERPGWRLGLTKLVVTVLTVGAGGSGGLVGPALLLGSGVTPPPPGSATAEPDRLVREGDRMVLAAGAAAAVAVLWGAPLASALLACEIIFRQWVAWSLVPAALIGGVTGTVVYRLGGGVTGLTATIPETWLLHLLLASLAGVVAALLGIGFVAGLRVMARLRRWAGPLQLRTGRGLPWREVGLMAAGGLFAVLVARVAGLGVLGFAPLQALVPWTAEIGEAGRDLGLAAGKALGTVATVGSGASGGVVGPALHIGAAAGRGLGARTGGCGVLLGAAGMAGCLAAVSNVPLAAAVLITETLGPAMAPFAVVAAGLGFGVARGWVAYAALTENHRGRVDD